jgi:uncharacterized protein (DUF58 family)
MYALLGVLLISRFVAREWVDHLTAERECTHRTAEVGDKAGVAVTVTNTGGWPIAWLLLEDAVSREALEQRPPRLKVEGQRTLLVRLGRGEQKSLRYTVRFLTRGYYQFGPVLLESGDLFGLHRRFRVETAPSFVLVYPRVVPITGFDIASRRPVGEVRLTHRLFEDPTRIAGVREYQPGDPLNRIHWRATARMGSLHCRLYEPSCVAGVTLLLDFHATGYPARNEPIRSELAIVATASLANAVYQLGQQVGLVTNARDAADRVRTEGIRREFRTRELARDTAQATSRTDRLRPVIVETRRGAEQFQRIREVLARAELTDGLTMSELALESASRLPRDASVVAVLPGATEETALALGSLRRRGFAVLAVVVLPDDDTRDDIGRLMAAGIEVRTVSDELSIGNLCGQAVLR